MKKQLIVLLLLFAVIGCKKDAQVKSVNATVIYTGELALDGCGWLIRIDSSKAMYSPVNLPDVYKKNSSAVTVSYNLLTTKYSCGMIPGNGFTQIKITTISNK